MSEHQFDGLAPVAQDGPASAGEVAPAASEVAPDAAPDAPAELTDESAGAVPATKAHGPSTAVEQPADTGTTRDESAGDPAAPSAGTVAEVTGNREVDEVIASLEGLVDVDVAEHVAVFERAHETLRRTLDDAGRG